MTPLMLLPSDRIYSGHWTHLGVQRSVIDYFSLFSRGIGLSAPSRLMIAILTELGQITYQPPVCTSEPYGRTPRMSQPYSGFTYSLFGRPCSYICESGAVSPYSCPSRDRHHLAPSSWSSEGGPTVQTTLAGHIGVLSQDPVL